MKELTLLEKIVAICIYLLFFAFVFSAITVLYSWLGIGDFKYLISLIIVLLITRT